MGEAGWGKEQKTKSSLDFALSPVQPEKDFAAAQVRLFA
jgi:hypothetical protein